MPESVFVKYSKRMGAGRTLVEQIASRFTVGGKVAVQRSFVRVQPRHVMTHDNTGAVLNKFISLGGVAVFDPNQPVFALDHDVQMDEGHGLNTRQSKWTKIATFAAEHGLDAFAAGDGIGHQLIVEHGYAWPGTMVVASDSHSNMYGGVACLGTPVVRTDAAGIWATGSTWWEVPRVSRVHLHGQLGEHATGKDVILTLCAHFNADQVLNHAVEFAGDGVQDLSIDQRLTIANMTTEWGAVAGVFPLDERLVQWYADLAESSNSSGVSQWIQGKKRHEDKVSKKTVDQLHDALRQGEWSGGERDAHYVRELNLDLSSVRPIVSGPHTLKIACRLENIVHERIKVQKAYLLSCVNARNSDLDAAASVLRGKKVHKDVELYISAASRRVQLQAEENGSWATLIDAGARPLVSGCGPCIGVGVGLLEEGQTAISATNRNFRGRMGHRTARAFLGSPETVAASAIKGFICSTQHLDDHCDHADKELIANENGPLVKAWETTQHSAHVDSSIQHEPVELIDGFPRTMELHLIWCDADNINTDGIYAGKYTYRDDMDVQAMAAVAMENYDPSFTTMLSELRKKGFERFALIGGYNFGCGSSREQAATALKHCGIEFVLAGSVNSTFQRNALNNGLLAAECPELLDFMRGECMVRGSLGKFNRPLSVDPNLIARFDFKTWTVHLTNIDRTFSLCEMGSVVQELIVAGGLENWIAQRQLPRSDMKLSTLRAQSGSN